MSEIFVQQFILVYFFYGLSFFSMGLAVLLEVGHSSELDFARALRPLAGFGLIHGSHEWFEMFLLIQERTGNPVQANWIGIFRIAMLTTSFLFLVAFGARLIAGPTRRNLLLGLFLAITAIWLIGLLIVFFFQTIEQDRIVAADVYTRYSLAIPGAALTMWGLILQRQKFLQAGLQSFGRDVLLAAIAFGLYGGIGQLFTSSSLVFPSEFINADVFMRWFGFPIQVFRAAMATIAAIFIIRSLRAFEVESNQQINSLREAQLSEQRRLEEMRSELLHRTVKAQESERQRIARELHDETGQTLTAIGMGLRGLTDTIPNNPQRAVGQAQQLESLATNGVKELQRLVSGLHPPQLDDLGLLAAIRWYASDVSTRYNIPVNVASQGDKPRLTSDFRAVVFRIAQEAVTNTVRHAHATRIDISLTYREKDLTLAIDDNGQGFDVAAILKGGSDCTACWGLYGMLERAALIGGTCQIDSAPGRGTRVSVWAPIKERVEDE